MTVKILVRRNVPEGKAEALTELIDQLRILATGQPGHVSGETLRRVDEPGETLVVTKWRTLGAWQRWQATPERTEIQKKIDQLLGEGTRYEIFEYE